MAGRRRRRGAQNGGDVVGNTMREGRSRANSDRPRLSESRLSVSGCRLDSKYVCSLCSESYCSRQARELSKPQPSETSQTQVDS